MIYHISHSRHDKGYARMRSNPRMVCSCLIKITRPCNLDPIMSHFYIFKLGCAEVGAHAHVVTLPVFIGNILDFLTFSG